ncbi:NAD(P)/FAD-dependent oxidoreductase [Planctomyces sp. SH-PL14]|uniref:NAD(P)/FAD-dependent oxidoreductase n=1 Tax=Planctomyces sp. SH-PL14 TaxID=1632864 RepID=UPI00078B30A5|nr:NAD(P)/FAD-dependent oxidoreductase [Planctomyces sp. SH-PL14]AMV17120.1 NADH dehydrogenase-like protein [Planctomyces sp. SH-PL14]
MPQVTSGKKRQLVIVGGGFAGINAARSLAKSPDLEITLIDRQNHHLFQPLLYQVAMAGLSPADIAAPIRAMLSSQKNCRVIQGEVTGVDLVQKLVQSDAGPLPFDYLLIACGARHSYFGREEWEEFAPGLKTLEQATEIRRRVLTAFETAERSTDPEEQRRLLTFVVVGGGPTGVELAGAIGEMSRFTLAKDFRRIEPRSARIVLIEAGPRILPMFSETLAARAMRDLEQLGAQVWTNAKVTSVDAHGVQVGAERLNSETVLWAAGVVAAPLSRALGLPLDRAGRIVVEPDLSVAGHPNIFAGGDIASFSHQTGTPLPGVAPVAMQAGRQIARNILNDVEGKPRESFRYVDKGQMATIGRSRAIVAVGRFEKAGFLAWVMWLVIHIYYLTGFKNRILVVISWAWSYLTFNRGARLIVRRDWRMFRKPSAAAAPSGESVPPSTGAA